jgi:hypothetical protein
VWIAPREDLELQRNYLNEIPFFHLDKELFMSFFYNNSRGGLVEDRSNMETFRTNFPAFHSNKAVNLLLYVHQIEQYCRGFLVYNHVAADDHGGVGIWCLV